MSATTVVKTSVSIKKYYWKRLKEKKSKELHNEYLQEKDKEEIVINTGWKSKDELISELGKKLWN